MTRRQIGLVLALVAIGCSDHPGYPPMTVGGAHKRVSDGARRWAEVMIPKRADRIYCRTYLRNESVYNGECDIARQDHLGAVTLACRGTYAVGEYSPASCAVYAWHGCDKDGP